MVNTSKLNRIQYLLEQIGKEPKENYTNGKTLEKLEKLLIVKFRFSYRTRLEYIKEIKIILEAEGIKLSKKSIQY